MQHQHPGKQGPRANRSHCAVTIGAGDTTDSKGPTDMKPGEMKLMLQYI